MPYIVLTQTSSHGAKILRSHWIIQPRSPWPTAKAALSYKREREREWSESIVLPFKTQHLTNKPQTDLNKMSSKNSKLEDSKVDDPYNWFKKEMKDNPAFEEQRFQQFIENRKSSAFEEKSKSKNFRDSDEGSMRGPGPLGFEGQAAYQFKPAGFQGIWLLFLISFFFTGIFTLVAGKVILDDLDNWDYVEDSDYEALVSVAFHPLKLSSRFEADRLQFDLFHLSPCLSEFQFQETTG